ncbi:MAG: serine/threonine protein kinase [Gammaproteobacteria bacterium]|nr:serine/threonine protein kinase [Gammaproteobacteria bacterium]
MNTHPFATLTPDRLLDLVEALGLQPDGRLLALNSYENRVYQVGIEEAEPLILKVYRPSRWSIPALEEEHAFALELAAREIPVVPPLVINDRSLHEHEGFRYALYPRRGGHAPELDDPDTREWLGRMLGRTHALGAVEPFAHRPNLDPQRMGRESRDYILAQALIPAPLLPAYQSVTDDLLVDIEAAFTRAQGYTVIRLHGDCHPGNILWTDQGPHFVDLDDCINGPALQDLWMLLSGERAERALQLSDVLAGYEDFHPFDPRELHLLEALRTLRLMSHAAWLARRWDDPAFPPAFPWFASARFWEDHILALREQTAAMQEPPLSV